ncbi:MAG: hypothetical protein HY334_07380 [Armatimonadetes bacterium]|nr:hypothetical protein [Armatimonadota bacterium]
MPVYEYRCVDNGHRFDLDQAVGADPPACPICGSATRKVYGSVGLIFKGSGFHVNDYRRPGAGTEGKPDGKPDEKQDGKTDATPAPAATESGTSKGGGEAAGAGTSTKATDA